MSTNQDAVSPLRRRMIEDMTIRHLTAKTQGDYIRHVRAFAVFLRRSPDLAEPEDLRRFQLHMAAEGASPSLASRVGAGIAPLRLSQNRTCGSRIRLLGSIYQNASDSWADACGGFRSFHKALSDAIRPLNQAGA